MSGRWDFFKRNVALYLRVPLWLDRFNDFNELLMVVTCTITNILMICRKNSFKNQKNKQQQQQQIISVCKLSLLFFYLLYIMQDRRVLVQA